MSTRDEYLEESVAGRVARLARTPADLATAIRDRSDAVLSRRPATDAWSAKDVVCHLRDIEELCILRFHLVLATEDPPVLVAGAPPRDPQRWGFGPEVPFPLDPDRWAEERQYRRQDTEAALAAFRRRRGEVLALLGALSPVEWRRGSLHPTLGRVTFEDWTAGMAAHDDSHLAQLARALDGKP